MFTIKEGQVNALSARVWRKLRRLGKIEYDYKDEQMIQKLLSYVGDILSSAGRKSYKIQSFTFYIPSPPLRKSGYREKQFDSIFYEFINSGYEVISFHTQNNNHPEHSGMWIICLVRATNQEASKLDLESEFTTKLNEKIDIIRNQDEQVEGLYQID